ncbi:discoidin domain-containing protein, partial [Kibdelosporangium lantanae]
MERDVHSLRRTLPLLAVATAAALVLPSTTTVSAAADVLLSQGRTVDTSTVESGSYPGGNAVDGNLKTRWASVEGADPQWLRVDLGETSTVHRVVLDWEAAYAKKYRLEISDDGVNFTTVTTVTDGNGGTDDLTGLSGHGRYLRLVGTTRATSYGYSLWEIQAFGTTDSTQPPGDTGTPSGSTGATTSSRVAVGSVG